MVNTLGSLTLILAVTMVIFALPSQIRKNWKEKKCGLTIIMVILPLCVYISRAAYSFQIKSLYILIPDTLGIIFSLILLVQYVIYKKTDKTKDK